MSVQKGLPNVKRFIIEGNIGAGKSTFLKILEQHLAIEGVLEPHAKWQDVGDGENLLDLFYKDTPRWAYTFQTYAFVTRVLEQEQRALKATSPIQVLERSVFSDRFCFAKNCYEMGLMSSLEWQLYQDWFKWLVEGYTIKPSGFIYLQTDPEVCHQRLVKRNRHEESAVSLDYLTKLHNKHQQWLVEKMDDVSFLGDTPVLVLHCNKEFENDLDEQQSHISKIAEFYNILYRDVSPFYTSSKEPSINLL
ncbi:MAG TPA: deoxynucleoside kinase [Candidatus Babeliales bacterium]|nr:deoxynucleoside kinase [Candidatus Babeliales bacterium]